MNKERRKKISIQIAKINDIASALQELLDEEQDYYDNMPENLQGSLRGDAAEEAIDALTDAVSSLEDAAGTLEEIA